MYWNIADRVVRPLLGEDYSLVAKQAAIVQQSINTAAGIGIKAQTAKLNKDRVDGILNRLDSEPNFDDVAWILQEPVMVFSRSVVDDTVKSNAEFQDRAGLSPKVVRTSEHKCCEWCSRLAGAYDYNNLVSNDVFRRHDNCRCLVEFVAGKSRKTIHSGQGGSSARIKNIREMDAAEKERKAAALQKRIDTLDRKKQLAEAERRGKIEKRKNLNPVRYQKDILIGKSVGAKSKDTRIELPDGSKTHLTPGSRVSKVRVIAGLGRDRGIDILDILCHEYPGSDARLWKKCKGIGFVDYEGESYKAELHWYEEKTIGRVGWRVKPDADGNWFLEDQ